MEFQTILVLFSNMNQFLRTTIVQANENSIPVINIIGQQRLKYQSCSSPLELETLKWANAVPNMFSKYSVFF